MTSLIKKSWSYLSSFVWSKQKSVFDAETLEKLLHDIEPKQKNFEEKLKQFVGYALKHKKEIYETDRQWWYVVQDVILTCAIYLDVCLEKEFEELFQCNLKKVLVCEEWIKPEKTPSNFCETEQTLLNMVTVLKSSYEQCARFANKQNGKRILANQIINLVCNNIDVCVEDESLQTLIKKLKFENQIGQ